MIFVTGGAGFIGSNFIRTWMSHRKGSVCNLDKLTYAGNLESLKDLESDPRYSFKKVDIVDQKTILSLMKEMKPQAVFHFAAESHVDRSISGPQAFIETNIVGTFHLLQASLQYWNELSSEDKKDFRFLHVSTDEVYGSLEEQDPPFSELTAYAPNSPYSASKASSDHLVRSYFHTFGLPTIITNCSNNYGPYQFPEKLIPLMIRNALIGKELPIYGDGKNVRDWLYVVDHCEALIQIFEKAKPGSHYNIGGKNEIQNIKVVETICQLLDQMKSRPDGKSYLTQKVFVKDRPGHDKRYAINPDKIESEIGWRPRFDFEKGISTTLKWYLENKKWVENVVSGEYKNWMKQHYGEH